MKKAENNKSNSSMVWGSLGLAAGCIGYVITGELWLLIGGIFSIAFVMIFKDLVCHNAN